MNKIDLEDNYQHYILLAYQGRQMPAEQEREIKMAFFGGIGEFIRLLYDKLSNLSEDQAVEVLDDLHQQTTNFFNEQDKRNEAKRGNKRI